MDYQYQNYRIKDNTKEIVLPEVIHPKNNIDDNNILRRSTDELKRVRKRQKLKRKIKVIGYATIILLTLFYLFFLSLYIVIAINESCWIIFSALSIDIPTVYLTYKLI